MTDHLDTHLTNLQRPSPFTGLGQVATKVEDVNVRVIIWHLAWAGFCVLILLLMLGLQGHLGVILALVASAIPGIAALYLSLKNEPWVRRAMIWVWALSTAAAVLLTGGIVGPLSAFVLMPIICAVLLNQRSLIPLGAALSLMSALINTGVSVKYWVELPDNIEALWLSMMASFATIIALGTALMPAFRARVERAQGAEEHQTRLLKLLTEQPSLILCLEASGSVINAYGEAPSGLLLSELMNGGLIAMAYGSDQERLRQALTESETKGRAQLHFKPHCALDHFWHLTLRRGDDGRLYGLLSDATLDQAKMMALESERNEAIKLNLTKSQFLANMSHELRTPLNAVLGFSDIMRQGLFGPISDKYKEYAGLIWESGQHVLDLINDVLDMSKIEAKKYELSREEFDLRETISSALNLLRVQAHEKLIQLKLIQPSFPLDVTADQRAMKQILLNLLSNALKFTSEGGQISVSLSLLKGNEVELMVMDNGIGIAPEDLKRLGRPYEQSGSMVQKAMGTGLGLSLVKALAQLHDGRMVIESTLGKGTSVSVILPILNREDAPSVASSDLNPLADRSLTPAHLSGFDEFVIRQAE